MTEPDRQDPPRQFAVFVGERMIASGSLREILPGARAHVQDNPLIFAEDDTALSGGNFHAEPVAFAADILALAICEIGSLSERRIAMLVDPALSGLPAFLTPRSANHWAPLRRMVGTTA